MTQPEALRLADMLENNYPLEPEAEEAAAELRRLHEENEQLRQALAQPEREWVDISTEELIEALKAANLPSIFSYRMACKVALDIAKDKNYTTIQQPDEFCTATTEELMKVLGCPDKKAKEIHDKAETLAQPEQKPVAWMNNDYEVFFDAGKAACYSMGWVKPLYTVLPKREWVGLTDEEMKKTWYETKNMMGWYSFEEIARLVEAKLKEKNT